MIDYKKGKIYCIKSPNTDLVYVGSTTRTYLSSRYGQHKISYKKNGNYCSSFEIFKVGDCYIELLELCPCDNIETLHKREGYYINLLNSVNKLKHNFNRELYDLNYKERKAELQKIRRQNKTEEQKEIARLRHNELQKIRRKKNKE